MFDTYLDDPLPRVRAADAERRAAERKAMLERGITKNEIISELTRSHHGNLGEYVDVGMRAAVDETEFFAHLIAWNHIHGQIRDAKVALPVLSLMGVTAVTKTERIEEDEIVQNALAHLALLDPRNFLRALDFARLPGVRSAGRARALDRLVERKLRDLESNRARWDRVALQHRRSLHTLYARWHVSPGNDYYRAVIFGRDAAKRSLPLPEGSVFEAVARLKTMRPDEAAGTIMAKKIPFLVAVGSMGARLREDDVVLAIINAMSPTELVNHMKMLEKLGVKSNPALRGALDAALGKAASSKRGTLKTSVAVEAIEDEDLKEKLRAVQEKQIDRLNGIEGDWLVAADRSPSMSHAIEFARHLTAVLARFVKGKVHVVFFDAHVHKYLDATGKDLDAITKATGRITAGGGGTSIGIAAQYAADNGLNVDAIAIVSDGAENAQPMFARAYETLSKRLSKEVPVYHYWMKCNGPNPYGNNPDALRLNMAAAGYSMEVFDLRAGFDYHSLPNVVQTMKTNRFGLVEQINETPLRTLDEVFN